jgi:hypothetical protein
MFKFGRQSDQILRPWTLNANFDEAIDRQCDELEKSLRRTSPYKQGGDYSYLLRGRFDNTDTDAAESFAPASKIPAHSDLTSIRSRSTQINIVNVAVSPRRLPNLAKHSPPSTREKSATRTRKMREVSKLEDKQQLETRILNDHRNFSAHSMYTSPNDTKVSIDTTPFSTTSRVKEISNQRHETDIEYNIGLNSTMPLIVSREMTETSSLSGLVNKAKSMPNLMEYSSVLDGIQERERRADMYSTKRTSFLKEAYSTSPGEVNHDFYTQNFDQTQKGKETFMNCLLRTLCTHYILELIFIRLISTFGWSLVSIIQHLSIYLIS